MADQTLTPRRPSCARVAERTAAQVILTAPLDCYLSLKALSAYAGIGVRTLREYLSRPFRPLPCYRVADGTTVGKILVRRSEFDAWMSQYRRVGDADVERAVAETLEGLRG